MEKTTELNMINEIINWLVKNDNLESLYKLLIYEDNYYLDNILNKQQIDEIENEYDLFYKNEYQYKIEKLEDEITKLKNENESLKKLYKLENEKLIVENEELTNDMANMINEYKKYSQEMTNFQNELDQIRSLLEKRKEVKK